MVYDRVLGLTVGPTGTPFVESAGIAATATETKAFPGDRDLATGALRGGPAPRPPTEETAVHRDRPRTAGQIVELWTNTSTRRDPGETTHAGRLRLETRVRRDAAYEQPPRRMS